MTLSKTLELALMPYINDEERLRRAIPSVVEAIKRHHIIFSERDFLEAMTRIDDGHKILNGVRKI